MVWNKTPEELTSKYSEQSKSQDCNTCLTILVQQDLTCSREYMANNSISMTHFEVRQTSLHTQLKVKMKLLFHKNKQNNNRLCGTTL